MTIGHLHINLREIFCLCHHIGIAHGLRLVDKHRLLQLIDVQINTLDFIDENPVSFPENAVRPTLDFQIKGFSKLFAFYFLQRK